MIFHAWNVPPVFGLGFILLIGVLAPEQVLACSLIYSAARRWFELPAPDRDPPCQILPGVFIPAAERYGLMPQLDRWVVRPAPGVPDTTCFINLSGATIGHVAGLQAIAELVEPVATRARLAEL